MIDILLRHSFFYREYQKIIRRKNNDYNFYKYIFHNINIKKLSVLDIGCGDSFILNYIQNDIDKYFGIDSNQKYLDTSKKNFNRFNFYNLDLSNIESLDILKKENINFIFLNGVIHHLNNKETKTLINYLEINYPNAIYLFIDPVCSNNKLINKLMIKLDRGKYILNPKEYKKILKNFNQLIINDFFKMEFKIIFNYKNFDLKTMYNNWKNINVQR